jgi:hypothetical protein
MGANANTPPFARGHLARSSGERPAVGLPPQRTERRGGIAAGRQDKPTGWGYERGTFWMAVAYDR